MNLQENQPSIIGNWWDPQTPTAKWHGTLSLTAGEPASLHLVDYGKSFLRSDSNRPLEGRGILHGTTNEGKAITLSKCVCLHRTRSFGSEETTFDVRETLFGEHLSHEDLTFDEVHVEFDYLDDWITYSRYEQRSLSENEDQKEIRIRLNPRHQFPFEAPGYAKSLFYLGYRTRDSVFKFSIQSIANLQIIYSEEQTLEAILKDLRRWTWFLTLATRHKTNLRGVSLHRDEVRFQLGDKTFKKPFDLWVSSEKRASEKNLHPPDMNFTLPDVESRLSTVISNWTTMQTSWAPVLHRYFASIHRVDLQLPEQFLFRAQALEALYRLKANPKGVNQKDVYGEAWDKASPSLQSRLGSKGSFVESVRNNRNYLTHYSPEDEKHADEFEELFDLNQKLGFLLETLILTEMGLPAGVIDNATAPHRWGRLVLWE